MCVSGIGTSMIKNASSVQRISLKHLLGNDVPSDALDLVNKLLLFNPLKRLNAEQALEHQYVSKFHDLTEEIVMNCSVITPLNDDIRLSIDDYRNKLYELISTHNQYNSHGRIVRNYKFNNNKTEPMQKDLRRRVTKLEDKEKPHCHYREKPCNQIHSEPRLNQTRIKTNNAKSDSKINKQFINFPSEQNMTTTTTFSGNFKKSIQQNDVKDGHTRKKINSKSNIYMSFNSYNPRHGIITQSALMELRAAGIR